jgi:hypothetical protein
MSTPDEQVSEIDRFSGGPERAGRMVPCGIDEREMNVHLWLNGAHGVGKTTTAERLLAGPARWRAFDAELVGYMLRANLPEVAVSNFQDLPPWRTLVPRVAREIADLTGDDLVIVQTVQRESYWRELVAGLSTEGLEIFHVVLDAGEAELRARIEADDAFRQQIEAGVFDAGALEFRRGNVDAYLDGRSWMIESADLVVDTARLGPNQVADEIRTAVARSNQRR